MSDNWPFDDADCGDPLTALRIPVTGAYPYHGYLAAYAGQAEPLLRWPRPNDSEAAVLASYISFLRGKYPPHVQRRMLAAPLDTGDLSALVFAKRGGGDWAYRRAHWTEGVFWWPLPEGCEEGRRLSLVPLLDHVETNNGTTEAPEWQAWKAAHPDVFGIAAELDPIRERAAEFAKWDTNIDGKKSAADVPRLLAALDAVLVPHQLSLRILYATACRRHQLTGDGPQPDCPNCTPEVRCQVCPECRDQFGDPVPFGDCRVRKADLGELTGKEKNGAEG